MKNLILTMLICLCVSTAQAQPAQVEVCHRIDEYVSQTLLVNENALDGYLIANPDDTVGACVVTYCPPGIVAMSEPLSTNCTYGGSAFTVCNNNLFATTYACNGPPGSDGSDGAVGAQGMVGIPGDDGTEGVQGIQGSSGVDGLSVELFSLNAGHPVCAYGGTEFVVGAANSYACSGAPGVDGSNGFDGADGATGPPGTCSCDLDCFEGTADCDGELANLCETDTTTETDCGGCGIICTISEVCFEGACCAFIGTCTEEECGTVIDDGCGGVITCDACVPALGGEYTSVSAGTKHTCSLIGSTILCWGVDGGASADFGQVTGPNSDGGTFTQVEASWYNTCGIRTDGSIVCWGHDGYGQLNVPNDNDFVQVSVGGGFVCGRHSDARITCWGFDPYQATGDANSDVGRFLQISTGNSNICGLRTNNTVICWGNNLYGEVSGPNSDSGTFIQIVSSHQSSCGIRTDGSIVCWGRDEYNKITSSNSYNGVDLVQLTAVGYTICGLRTNGSIICWGIDDESLFDYGQVTGPNSDSGTFIQVEAGVHHTCGLRDDGSITCWGWDTEGQSTVPTL